ncbi:MAG: DUF2142 domain-containing protein [Streptococcaceae bacterium]|nr:DUF2142 domain-containing protein [Streptococcaceae bacterium]MCL2681839.1 DUF2142 domain-containing protein [Streptococcaceae bacterium]
MRENKQEYSLKKRIILIIIGIFILFMSQVIVSFIPFTIPSKTRLFISAIAITLYFLFAKYGKKENITRNVALLIVLFGGAACIVKPIQFGLDEETHLSNTIQLADGNLISQSIKNKDVTNTNQPDYLAVYKYDALRNPNAKETGKNIDPQFFSEKHYPSQYTSKFSGISNFAYIPNALGWDIGRLISNKIFVSYYLGRFFNVLAYALLVLIAFRISRYYKGALYIIAAFPATLWIVAGYSYDYLYYGLSLILIAMFTNFIAERKITRKQIVQFIGTSTLFIFPKFPFVLVGILALLLPKSYYKDKKDRIYGLILYTVSGFLSLLWYMNSTIIGKIFHSVNSSNSSSTENTFGITYFIHHPLPMIRTFFSFSLTSLGSYFGINISHPSPPSPLQYTTNGSDFLITTIPVLMVFLMVILTFNLEFSIPKYFNWIFLVLLIIISCLIIYAVSGDSRLAFDANSLFVRGSQSRYFYFFFLIVPLLLSGPIKSLLKMKSLEISENEIVSNRISNLIQYIIVFLNILVLGVALYTLLVYHL